MSRPYLIASCGIVAAAIAAAASVAAADNRPHRVVVRSFAFEQQRLEVKVGDRVEWVNEDIAPHTATAVSGEWDTGALTRGQSAAISFGAPGTFAYRCAYHPQMRATIVVTETEADGAAH